MKETMPQSKSGISKNNEFSELKEHLTDDISNVSYWSSRKYIKSKITLNEEEILAIKEKIEARREAKEKLDAKTAHINRLAQPKNAIQKRIASKYQTEKFKPKLGTLFEQKPTETKSEHKEQKSRSVVRKGSDTQSEKEKEIIARRKYWTSRKYIRNRNRLTDEEELAIKLRNQAKKEAKARLEAKIAHLNKLATPRYVNKKYVPPVPEIPTFQPNLNFIRAQVSRRCRSKKDLKNHPSSLDPRIEENYWRKVTALFYEPTKHINKLSRPKIYQPKKNGEIKPTRSPYVLSIMKRLTKFTSGSYRIKRDKRRPKRKDQFAQLKDLYLRKPQL